MIIDFWEGLVKEATPLDCDKNLNTLVQTAQKNGFQYIPKKELIKESTLQEFVNRINAASHADDHFTKKTILGGYEENFTSIKLSEAKEEFFNYQSGNQSRMSENQLRKWKNPRDKAIRNFIQLHGDKPIGDITRQDVLDFRAWWVSRIQEKNLTANSANKDFSYLGQIVKAAIDNHGLGISPEDLFRDISLRRIEKTRRYPFSNDHIESILLKPHNVHEEITLLMYAMTDTGARISELVGLEEEDIILNETIPFISIRPNNTRDLKTPQSERMIPLVGASLYAFRKLNGPFKHYFGKSDLISNTGNKFFRENNIFPSKNHSIYSLRHSFEDRLTAVEPPDKVQAALMGHKYARPRYGAGPSLEQKLSWLQKIAFKV